MADATAGGLQEVRGGDATPALFIALEEDGTIRITCHRSEMGQQVWTSMAQIIAEELEADWSQVAIVQAPGDARYGDQNTDGSRSVRWNFHRLRVAGAAMRTMLERAAAARWGVAPGECRAAQSVVTGPGMYSATYAELAQDAAAQPLPTEAELRLKPREQWRLIGKEVPSLTVPDIVQGQGTFGIDVQLPDMLVAVVAHPPQVMASVAKLDDKAALAVPGVVRTVRLPALDGPVLFKPLGGVAVVATDTWSAIRGRAALKIEWEAGPNAGYDSQQFAETMLETARQPGTVRLRRGDVDAAMGASATRIEADYYVPHLSQTPMEPPMATARWDGDKVECWVCVQAPQRTRSVIAQACGIPEENVTVNVTWLGGGFGRKSKPDFAVEAALVAREVGRPVKLTWTREDDLQHGYYHSVSAQHLEGALDAEGKCTGILHRTVFPPIGSTFVDGLATPSWEELRQGVTDNPFHVPNLQVETGDAPAHVRIGWLRSVANIYHAFAVQSFAAELAHAAGRDQKDYLLELIGPPRQLDPRNDGAQYDNYGESLEEYPIDTGRLANVVREAAALAGWGRELPAGHGLGIAVHRSFVSYVATVIEVAVDAEGRLRIPGVWSAIDAGTVVNTRHVTAQVEGGTLYALSNALYGEITAKDGAVEQANFPQFRLMRMKEAPRDMAVTIVASDAPPGGVGEPPSPPAAPALANAIFAATGLRIRRLPIFGSGSDDRLPLDATREGESA
ncbi:xanthine dehydrogenase family protein molybdopterin-binding subunit [Mangrovimicrobium sediminis]|uniref:Xanthine dehydrogenase family protein molybdopterin-binding subunit n=2 Tax=Mangrovimicrobium sediminis TaxID=2562682 RepID=A0A4Z0M2K4_9GAMM|nr:xanthine dehydrogenase family protein molybdopterin-binding subunit [Haliea sp. SAOS-164]